MLVRALPAAAGLEWLRDGVRLFRAQPLGLPAMMVVYLVTAVGLPNAIPNSALALGLYGLLSPLAFVGWMNACSDAAEGRAPMITVYARFWRDPAGRNALLALCAVGGVLMIVFGTLADLAAPIQSPRATAASESGSESTSEPGSAATLQALPLSAMLTQLLIIAPVGIAMWFAPLLASWHQIGPAKAMFGSVVACWRNMLPMLMFSAAAGALALSVLLAGSMLVAVARLDGTSASLVLGPIVLVLASIVQASFLPMYRAIYGDSAPADADAADQETT
jgi:uncharacterized membrane protein